MCIKTLVFPKIKTILLSLLLTCSDMFQFMYHDELGKAIETRKQAVEDFNGRTRIVAVIFLPII